MPTSSESNETNSSIVGHNPTQKRLQQTHAQIDEIVGIMSENVQNVIERDQKLSDLDERADALHYGATQFEQQANKLRVKQWWANMKMTIILGCIGLILVIVIIASLWRSGSSSNEINKSN